jgi:hypothetical protein
MNSNAPHRFNFSHTELVGHLDMVGEVLCQMCNGQPMPLEVASSAITVLRSVRDDLAAKSGLPTRPLFREPAYLAECAMRDLTEAGTFDRNTPYLRYNDEEGA